MAETQGDIYVRKDVFDARMDRMEMLLEKTVMEIKSYVDKSTGETKAYVEKAMGEIKAEVQKNGNDIRVLTARVDALEQTLGARIGAVENTLSWWIALFAAFIAITAFISPVVAFFKKVFQPSQPSITLEDVKRVAKEITETTAGEIAEQVASALIERHLSGGK